MLSDVIRCALNIDQVSSPNIIQFFAEAGIRILDFKDANEVNIPLSFLRKVYQKNRPLFFRLVAEFGLRGYQVISDSNSSLFYTDIDFFDNEEFNNEVLTVDKSINGSFKSLILPTSIKSFLTESNVQSSSFFIGINVNNLFKVFSDLDRSILTSLNKVGIHTVDRTDIHTSTQIQKLNESAVQIDDAKITQIFDPHHEGQIIRAFYTNDIRTVSEVTNENLLAVMGEKGIGAKKRSEILDRLQMYHNGSLPLVNQSSSNESQENIFVFPEIIINSRAIRTCFAKHNKVHISCTTDGVPSNPDVMVTGVKSRSKKFNDTKNKIQFDIQQYLSWKAEHTDLELDSGQYNLMLKYFGLSDELKASINELNEPEFKELEQELLFEYNNSLDKRIRCVRNEIENKISKRKNWSTINRMMTKFDKKKPTLQEIGVVVGVTRERVRQIEKKIYAIKSNAVVDYRLEGAVAIEYEAANIPLLVKSELNNELSTLLCQSGSKFIVKDSPFVLVDFQNPRYDDFKEITELLGEAGEVDIDALWNVFESFKGSRDEGQYKTMLLKTIKEFYGFKYILNNTLYKSLSKRKTIYNLIHAKFGNNFSIDELDIQKLETQYNQITGETIFSNGISSDKRRLLNNSLLRFSENQPGLLYIGNGKYEDDPSDRIGNGLKNQMVDFINEALLSIPSIKIHKVFSNFKNQLTSVGIDSPNELYFVFKQILADTFAFAEGNDYSIWPKNAQKLPNDYVLIELLSQNQGKMDKSVIAKKLGWAETSVEQTSSKSPYLAIRNGVVIYRNISIPENVRKFLIQQINFQTRIHPQYLLAKLIQDRLKKDFSLINDVPTEMIQSLNAFGELIVSVDGKWKGFPQIMYSNESVDLKDVIDDHFGDKAFDREDYSSFLKSLGYSNITGYMKLQRLQEDDDLLQVGVDKFVFSKYLKISDDEWNAINSYLLSLFKKSKSFVSLDNIIVNGPALPNIHELTWTKDLLFSLARHSKVVRTLPWNRLDNHTTLPFDPEIIVKQDSNIKSVLELAQRLLGTYQGNLSETNVKKFFEEKHILIGKSSTNELPKIFDSIISVDTDNVVHLKEVNES